MLGLNPGLLRLRHRQSDARTTRLDLKGHFWNMHRKIYLNCNANPHNFGLVITKFYIFCDKKIRFFSFSRDTVPLRARLWSEGFFQMSHHFADSFPPLPRNPSPHPLFPPPQPLPPKTPLSFPSPLFFIRMPTQDWLWKVVIIPSGFCHCSRGGEPVPRIHRE